MSTHQKLCEIEVIFRSDNWVDMNPKDNFNDKTYKLTPIDLIFMLKIYQEKDFAFLENEGPKFNRQLPRKSL